VNSMEERVRMIEAQFKGWTASIDDLAAAAQKSKGWARIDLRQGIDDLKVKRALLRTKLDEFWAAGSTGREGLRKDLERAWRELKSAFEGTEIPGTGTKPYKESKR